MKKTITFLAASASTVAMARLAPPQETKTICLGVGITQDRLMYGATCDSSKNNEILQKEILKNGCAAKQVAITARKYQDKWYPQISACMRPNVVQL